MPHQPPSFGSQEYWDARFTSNSHPFEWLEAPTALDPYLVEALSNTGAQQPQLLHIGCGTSLLSYHLRAHVVKPEQIHNLDYSHVAIDIGRKREREIYNASENEVNYNENNKRDKLGTIQENDQTIHGVEERQMKPVPSQFIPPEQTKTKCMRWSSTDLLDHSSLLRVCEPAAYSIIVDKSTSDSIACAEDIYVSLPYPVQYTTAPNPLDKPLTSRVSVLPEPVHPLYILAVHLAFLTLPKARWISLSYSQERYPFCRPPPPAFMSSDTISGTASTPTSTSAAQNGPIDNKIIPQAALDGGFPDPTILWRLKTKHEVEVPAHVNTTEDNKEVTHRPKVLHWVYVLERTDVPVFAQKQ
jgi:hypothetical protein